MTDFTVDYYYEYNGEEWVMMQNGKNIIIAKRSALVKMDKYRYALSDDSKGKIKEMVCNISDVDVITLKKE